MGRARAHDSDEDEPRSSRHRGRGDSGDEDQPEYDYEKRPRRGKSDKHSRARDASADEQEEEDEEDSEEDSRRHKKQLVVREKSKKAKSSRKRVARKKRDDSSDSSAESSEEETKREKEKKKEKKRKSKSHNDEIIKISKWEDVHRDEVDRDFVNMLSEELGHHIMKIYEWIEQNLLRRHTQTGEYNIDLMFERGVLGRVDKEKRESYVKKAQGNPQRKRVLYSSVKTGEVVFDAMGTSMHTVGPSMHPMGPSMRPTGRRGDSDGWGIHIDFHPRCPDCRRFGAPCGLYL
ncbi:MAG: hypothetical protein Q9199_000964 [Rusavskia elegans]